MRARIHAGFTLIEILVVVALLSIVAGFALFVSLDTYRGATFRSERASLVASLQHARALAMHGVCTGNDCTMGRAHGVSVQSDRYVIFQGSSYAGLDSGQDTAIDANPSISHGGLSETVFASLSGNTNQAGDITLTDATGHTSTITIGQNGQIQWSN
jgi:prepilin-type N-terminal cleavage/methylation domain-containing protein